MKMNGTGIEVKFARVLVGMKGHRPSGKNACVGAALKGKEYAKVPKGMGGRHNVAVRQAFYDAAKACGFKIKKPRPA
jgi:hypothetical protein